MTTYAVMVSHPSIRSLRNYQANIIITHLKQQQSNSTPNLTFLWYVYLEFNTNIDALRAFTSH